MKGISPPNLENQAHELTMQQRASNEALNVAISGDQSQNYLIFPSGINKRTHASTLYKQLAANRRLEQIEPHSMHQLTSGAYKRAKLGVESGPESAMADIATKTSQPGASER